MNAKCEPLQHAVMQVLALCCTDIQNILKTVAEAPATVTTLEIHMNNKDALAVSRCLLLLELVGNLDINRVDDLDFLWSVWYCLELPAAYHRRLQPVIKKLLEGLSDMCPAALDREAVANVLSSWLQGKAISTRDVLKQRFVLLMRQARYHTI
jgi:Domain of unknown function (DUF4470)